MTPEAMREILTETEVVYWRLRAAQQKPDMSLGVVVPCVELDRIMSSHEELRAQLAAKAGRCVTCAEWNADGHVGALTCCALGVSGPRVAVNETSRSNPPEDFGCSLWTERTER